MPVNLWGKQSQVPKKTKDSKIMRKISQQAAVSHRTLVSAACRWSRLTRLERQITLEALVVVGAVSALVSTFPSSFTSMAIRRVIVRATPSTPQTSAYTTMQGIELIRSAITRASLRIPKASCLVQALSGWWMLKRRKIPSQLRIGVEKGANGFSAHAWLCVGDTIVIGGEDAAARFVTLETAP